MHRLQGLDIGQRRNKLGIVEKSGEKSETETGEMAIVFSDCASSLNRRGSEQNPPLIVRVRLD